MGDLVAVASTASTSTTSVNGMMGPEIVDDMETRLKCIRPIRVDSPLPKLQDVRPLLAAYDAAPAAAEEAWKAKALKKVLSR